MHGYWSYKDISPLVMRFEGIPVFLFRSGSRTADIKTVANVNYILRYLLQATGLRNISATNKFYRFSFINSYSWWSREAVIIT